MFKKATNSEYEQDFKHVLDSVCGFAYDNTRGKEKKHLKTNRVEALGGKRTKNETQPYHIMMAIQKAAEKREKRRQEEVRSMLQCSFSPVTYSALLMSSKNDRILYPKG